jgi:hypothetical protein
VFRLVKPLLPLLLAAIVCAGCARHKSNAASQPTTQTIAPADAQPAPNGTDPMTQTVEVDDSRSESDGMTTAPSAPAQATKKAPAKAAKKKGKK